MRISLSKFLDVSSAFYCERAIGNLWSIHLEVNILRRVTKSEWRSLLFCCSLKLKIFPKILATFIGFSGISFIWISSINLISSLIIRYWISSFLFLSALNKSFCGDFGFRYFYIHLYIYYIYYLFKYLIFLYLYIFLHLNFI